MSRMFYKASLFNQDVGWWSISHVTNMSQMFENASAFNQPLTDWDVRHITDISGYKDMFKNSGLTQTNWNKMKATSYWSGKTAENLGLNSSW